MSLTDVSPEILSLVKSFLKRKGRIAWIDWLPLAELAVDSPIQLVEAFNSLGSTSNRAEFVELLAQQDSGPLADSLLIIIAKYALQISDEQVRDFVVEDVSKAIERTQQRLKAMENACEPLKEQAVWIAERLKQGFDIAHEITRLEAHLAKLRAEEHDKAEEYDQIHALEREIIRLETYRRSFAGYDLAERSRYKNELSADTEQLREQKESMQLAIAEDLERRDTARNEVSSLQQQHDTLQNELNALVERGKVQTEGIAVLQSSIANTRTENEKLKLEHAELVQRYDDLDRANREAKERLTLARTRLDELQAQAVASGRGDIEAKIRELYAMLPADKADEECR